MSERAFTFSVAPALGFYDGIFGPGVGSFFLLGFVTLLGFGVLRASAHTRLLNFTSNIAALGDLRGLRQDRLDHWVLPWA